MSRFFVALFLLALGQTVVAQNLDIRRDVDAIGDRPCTVYASWVVRMRGANQLQDLQPDDLAQIYSIRSYLLGAYLAFPGLSYSDFEAQFVEACFDRPNFPATQVVAFFMLYEFRSIQGED